MLRVAVLDADILYPPVLRDMLVSMAYWGLFEARWSSDILDEVERNLISKAGLSGETAKRRVGQLKSLLPQAMVTDYAELLSDLTNHPKDRHVVAAARKTNATAIVTRNIRHYHPLPPGMVAVHPDVFMSRLVTTENLLTIHECLDDVRSGWPRPPTAQFLLDRLGQLVPEFAAKVSDAL